MNTLEKATSDNSEDWPIFSYTQLQSWDRCEYSWYLGYDQEWTKKDKKTSANIGTLAHKYLELYYRMILEGTIDRLVLWDAVETSIAADINAAIESSNTNTLAEIHRAAIIVKRYIFEFAPDKDIGMKVLGVEHHFIIPYKTPTLGYNFYLQGYVDLLYSKGGKIRVVDHKTTANAGFWKPGEIMMDPQMTLYVAALRRTGMKIFEIEYNFLNSYDYKDMSKVTTEKLFKREPSYRTDVEVQNFEYQLLLEIEKLIKAAGDEEYRYHRSLRRDCDNCMFKEPCLHGLKGINPQAILVTKFIKKEKMPIGIRPRSIA